MKRLFDSRVLIIAERKEVIDQLVRTLRGEYGISFAMSGDMAMKVMKHSTPDLVLLEVELPDVDGYQLCARMRAVREWADIPVLFLAPAEEMRNKNVGFEAGGNDFLFEPFEDNEVRARVASLLKAKAYQDALRHALAHELSIARDIQRAMLPRDLDYTGKGLPVEVAARLQPTLEVGGDLYHANLLDDHTLFFVVGDASGKGIPAAMFMMVTTMLLRAAARHSRSPVTILREVNQELSFQNDTFMFVTLLCGVLDLRSGEIRYASGGHTSPMLVRAGRPPILTDTSVGTAIGLDSDIDFEERICLLRKGDIFVVYTDGVTEAFNEREECYGEERMLAHIGLRPCETAEELAEGLMQSVREFADGYPQTDDIALMAICYRGDPPRHGLEPMRFTGQFPATQEAVMASSEEVVRLAGTWRVPPSKLHDLQVVLVELASNIVTHGYGEEPGKMFCLSLESHDGILILTLSDEAAEYNPLDAPLPDFESDLNDRPIGGLGVHLVRELSDQVTYERVDERNVVRVRMRV